MFFRLTPILYFLDPKPQLGTFIFLPLDSDLRIANQGKLLIKFAAKMDNQLYVNQISEWTTLQTWILIGPSSD